MCANQPTYLLLLLSDNRHARAALAAELLLLGDARHPHMGHRAGDAAGAPLTARSQDTSRPWPVHVHTLLMSTEPSHEPGALRHAPRGPSNWPRLLSLPRPGSRLPNRTSRLQAVFAMKDLALTTDSSLVAGVRCARSQCRCRVQTPIAVTGGCFKRKTSES